MGTELYFTKINGDNIASIYRKQGDRSKDVVEGEKWGVCVCVLDVMVAPPSYKCDFDEHGTPKGFTRPSGR